MRDIKRIDRIHELIKTIWDKYPDMRYFQLIYNLQRKYSNNSSNYGKIVERIDKDFEKVGYDFFNLEDDDLIKYLETIVRNGL